MLCDYSLQPTTTNHEGIPIMNRTINDLFGKISRLNKTQLVQLIDLCDNEIHKHRNKIAKSMNVEIKLRLSNEIDNINRIRRTADLRLKKYK